MTDPKDDDLTGAELRVLLERIALALEGILDVKRIALHTRRRRRGEKKQNPKDPNQGD